jgi:oligo-1,6-glucosidase
MVKLRKGSPVLIYGKYALLDKDNPDVYAYTRELDGKKMLVLLNFRNKTASAKTDIDMSRARLVIGNYPDTPKAAELRPYEAAVYEW